MARSPFVWRSRVRFGDTDLSGRVFYASLLRHFDAAETEFLRSLGCNYSDAQMRGGGFPRVRLECDYISALKIDDLMDIEVTVQRLGGSSFTLGFAAGVDGRLAARASLTIVALDRETGKSMPLPDALRAALTPHLAAAPPDSRNL